MTSDQIIAEIALNEAGQHAHEAKKSRKRKKRRRPNVKLSERRPKSPRRAKKTDRSAFRSQASAHKIVRFMPAVWLSLLATRAIYAGAFAEVVH
jgi:hypothetical protein